MNFFLIHKLPLVSLIAICAGFSLSANKLSGHMLAQNNRVLQDEDHASVQRSGKSRSIFRLTVALLHQSPDKTTAIDEQRLFENSESGRWNDAALSEYGLQIISCFDVEIAAKDKSKFSSGQNKVVPRGKTKTRAGTTTTSFQNIDVGSTLNVIATPVDKLTQVSVVFQSTFYLRNQVDSEVNGEVFQILMEQLQFFNSGEIKQTRFTNQDQGFVLVTRLVPIAE